MRRFVLILLMVMLPFQAAWSMAATFCSHESDPKIHHFGHHTHVHKAGAAVGKATSAKAHGSSLNAPDTDCPNCNLSVPFMPHEVAALGVQHPSPQSPVTEVRLHDSALTETPERPNWSLAA